MYTLYKSRRIVGGATSIQLTSFSTIMLSGRSLIISSTFSTLLSPNIIVQSISVC